jgi:trimeric autotransporter adhesin
LDIASLTVAMNGYQYQCVITNSCGNMTTTVVSLTVNPVTATIAANNKTKTYGDDNPSLEAITTGAINGDVLNYSLATTTEKFSPAGSYSITVTVGSNPNYSIALTNGNLQVEKKALTITAATGSSKVYDGNTTASVTTDALNTIANVKLSDDRINNDVFDITFTSADFNSRNAGDDHVITVDGLSIAGAAAGNYTLTQATATTSNNSIITPKDLSVSARGIDKVFDGNTVANATLSTDKLAGDNVTASFTTANFADFNQGTWAITITGISITGVDAGNYNLMNNTADASAKILKASTSTTLLTSAATVRYMDPFTMTAKIKPLNTAAALTGTVQFYIGGIAYGSPINVTPVPGDVEGTVEATFIPQITNLPNAYTVTAVFTSTNDNYEGSTQTKPVTVLQRNASAYNDSVGFYTGTLFAWTSGANSSTASITLATTIKDNSAPRGDMRGARVTFYMVNGTTLTPITGAQNIPVGLVDINDGSVGTASALVQFNIGSNNAQNFLIAVGVSGAYSNNPNLSSAQTIVTVSKPVAGGYVVGGGRIENISSSGYIKGKQGLNTDFQADIAYTKSGTNPKGKTNVLIRSYYKTDGTLDTELHTYIITSTAISVLNVAAPTATFTTKANLYEQMPDLSLIQIEGGSTFEMISYQNGCDQKVAITLYRKAGGIWYSSNWNGTATAQQNLNGGLVFVTGGGSCSSAVAIKSNSHEDVQLNTTMRLAVKAYPNPSTSYFKIMIESRDEKTAMNLRVLDISGKQVEMKRNIFAGQTIELGNNYLPGMYIVEIIQGDKKIITKLVKQAN